MHARTSRDLSLVNVAQEDGAGCGRPDSFDDPFAAEATAQDARMHILPASVWRLAILGFAALMPIAGFVAVRALDDRPTLHDGTAAMTAIVDETVAALGPGRQITLNRMNVPAPPFEKQEDRLDYNQCDDWRSKVLPGWEAGLSYTIPTRGERDRAAVFATVEALWSTRGGELTGDVAANGGLELDLDHAHYGLYVDQVIDEVVLFGATRCLPT